MRRFSSIFLLLLVDGCADLACGPGTEKRQDERGHAVCVAASATGVPCDADGGARIVGGVCVGDPGQFPSCGPGTKLDPATGRCVADQQPASCTPPACGPADADAGAGTFCVYGVVRYLKDNACTAGKTFQVVAYDPIELIFDPKNAKPVAATVTDGNGGYKIGGLKDKSMQQLAVVGAIDPEQSGMHAFILSGSGARNVVAGGTYRVDLYAIEATMVGAWNQQAGLAGAEAFDAKGGYVARYFDGAEEKKPVAGVKLTFGGATPANTFYFKGDPSTIDKALDATDAATGAAIQRVTPGNLGPYGGSGGGVTSWEVILGAGVPGAIFVQKFHPQM